MLPFSRRRSLALKALVLVPVLWLLITLVLSVTDRFRVEEGLEVAPPTEDDKYEGRRPRQSLQEDDVVLRGQQQQGDAVLPPPREPDGPGELGRPVKLTNLTDEQRRLVKQGWEKNAFNQYVSDLMSLHRSLPEVRGRG